MKLAIIGMGPRGLASLERLIHHTAENGSIGSLDLLIFEKSARFGYGHVYDIEQPDTNWINITERAMKEFPGRRESNINGKTISSIKPYYESTFSLSNQLEDKIDENYPDLFPRRSTIGKYLNHRYQTLIRVLVSLGLVRIINDEVTEIVKKEDTLKIFVSSGDSYNAHEALVTIGHQATENDKQLEKWKVVSQDNDKLLLFTDAYPIENLTKQIAPTKHDTIALRGFGLAAIDVIRALVELYGGQFETRKNHMEVLSYIPGPQSISIIPFTLNGEPPVPKPYSEKIDKAFTPSPHRLDLLVEELTLSSATSPKNHLFFVHYMATLIAEMYLSYYSTEDINEYEINQSITQWIISGKYDRNHMTSDELSLLEVMKLHVNMSLGRSKANLDYFAGQVWRHCQPSLYNIFSHSGIDETVMTEIIRIDERIKRYSYGPPSASMQQLILLAENNVLDLKYIDDPEISFNESEGWNLKHGDSAAVSRCMINTIIDNPEILKIKSKLVNHLLNNDLIKPVHRKLGLETRKDGQIISGKLLEDVPIYVLGRIAKGSVMGVDAILECFGCRIDDWASACADRILSESN